MKLSTDERFLVGCAVLVFVAAIVGPLCPTPFGPFIAAGIVAGGNWIQFTFRRP